MKDFYKLFPWKLLFVVLLMGHSMLSKADIFITITTPTPTTRTDSLLSISVDVLSVASIDSVKATVDGRSVLLVYSTFSQRYEGKLNLGGLSEGTKTLSIVAANSAGETVTKTGTFIYDTPPKVVLTYPLQWESYQTKLRIKAVVSDVGSTAVKGQVTLTGATINPIPFVNSIDTLIDILPRFQHHYFTIYVSAVDSFNQSSFDSRRCFVEKSTYLTKVFASETGGQIVDFKDTRALLRYYIGTPPLPEGPIKPHFKIWDGATGTESIIELEEEIEYNSFTYPTLCEGGAAIGIYYDTDSPTNDSMHLELWRNNRLTHLSDSLGTSITGYPRAWQNYLVWANTKGQLCITNLTTLVTTYTGGGNVYNFNLSRDGVVAYIKSPGSPASSSRGNLFTYDITTGVTQQITTTNKAAYPIIDKGQITYLENRNTSTADSLIFYNGVSNISIGVTGIGYFSTGTTNWRFSDSCILFNKANSSNVNKLFLRTPGNIGYSIVPTAPSHVYPDKLGDNGQGFAFVQLSPLPARYYFDTTNRAGFEVSGANGDVYYQDSVYYLALGNTIYRYFIPNSYDLPKLISVSPDTAWTGSQVTVRGRHFTGVTAVKFGGVSVPFVMPAGQDTLLTVTIGNGATGDVVIVTPVGTDTLKNAFVYLPAPVVTAITPTSASQGDVVTIKGMHLGEVTAISFGGVSAASFSITNDSTIAAIVGTGASGNVIVAAHSGRDTISGFVFTIPPTITALSANSGLNGATITITGTGFTGATAVKFGGTDAASFVVVDATTITAVLGGGATGAVTVTTAGGTATINGFTYQFGLPGNNFSLKNSNITCRNANDGSIAITAVQSLNYSAHISGTGLDSTFTFTTGATVTNLAAGTYELCVTVDGQTGYEQCFTGILSQPEDLSVFVAVAPQQVVLSLGGSVAYRVSLNDSVFSTTSSTLTLPVRNGRNTLSVSTDKYCQGTVYKEFTVMGGLAVYPNPFHTSFSVNLGAKVVKQALVQVFDGNGRLALSKVYRNQSGLLSIDLPQAAPGLYVVKVSADGQESNFKILKN
jgi:hypothetical protein